MILVKLVIRRKNLSMVMQFLDNVIERVYGVHKERFPILDKMPPYPIDL